MTYSLLGYEPSTASIGLCSFTSSPAHGQRCPHFKKNVGIVTSQGFAHRMHGEFCLKSLELGMAPDVSIKASLKLDRNAHFRQIAVIDAQGRPGVFTGDSTKEWRGHIEGDNFIAAGNYLSNSHVLDAMATRFSCEEGHLADRLLAGCIAGAEAGGERGGAYSGFLIVVRPDQMLPWGAHVDIRIDFAPDLIPSMIRALAAYRQWERDSMFDPRRTLDGTLPCSTLREFNATRERHE